MKYMLLMNYDAEAPPMSEWAPEDVQASGAAMAAIHEELTSNGELLGAAGLAGPASAKLVRHDGNGAPIIVDGPFPEAKEFLAGYWLIDVDSEERAIEIAARTSAAPGAGGTPAAREIQVRPVMRGGDSEM